jgi:uncharacterized protein (TIGR03083 family)
MRKSHVIAALRSQRAATLAQLRALERQAWAQPCLPPWAVRDVVAHLVAIDQAAVTGRLLPLLRAAKGRADVERWNTQVVSEGTATPEELVATLERAGERLAAVAQGMPPPLWRMPVRTVFGRHPLAFLPARRVLDEWVHTVDIARATDGGHAPVPCADVLAAAVLGALPTLTLPGLVLPAGVVRLEVQVDGTTRRWGIDFSRRQYGERVTAPADATVRLDVPALALLVEGRAVDGYGPVEIEGDPDLAGRLIDALPAG